MLSLDRRRFLSGRWLSPLALAALLAAGCGLADYEKKLAAETERLNDIEKYLDAPLEFPPKVEGEPPPDAPPTIPLFIRPPKGISRTSDTQSPGFLVVRYGGQPERFQALYLAATSGQKWKQFRDDVQSKAGAVDLKDLEKTELNLPGRKPLPMERRAPSPEAPNYFIYLIDDPDHDYQVAVIYEVNAEQAASPDVTKAIDASLRSLVFGPQAARMRYKLPEPPPTQRSR